MMRMRSSAPVSSPMDSSPEEERAEKSDPDEEETPGKDPSHTGVGTEAGTVMEESSARRDRTDSKESSPAVETGS